MVFHSLSKRSSAAGLRSGFVAGDPDVLARLLRLRAYASPVQPLPLLAAATALWQDEAHVEANRALYRAKFDLAQRRLGNRFGFYRPAGGFFLWLDVGDGEAACRRALARGRDQGAARRLSVRRRAPAPMPARPTSGWRWSTRSALSTARSARLADGAGGSMTSAARGEAHGRVDR